MMDANSWPDLVILDKYIWPGFPDTFTGNATAKEIPIINTRFDQDHSWNASAPAGDFGSTARVKDAWEMMREYPEAAQTPRIRHV